MLGVVCWYSASVIEGDACPSSSDTTLTGTPEASISEAAVCRVSCRRIFGSHLHV